MDQAPPLSVGEAIRIATGTMSRQEVDGLALFSICLRLPTRDEDDQSLHHFYFYFLQFKSISGANREEENLVVTLDGKVVQPSIEPLK